MARQNEATDIINVMLVNEDSGSSLKGKRICITGHMGTARKELARLIAANGGVFHDSVKWDTNLLVTNKDWTAKTVKPGKSNKLAEAEARGIKVINEQVLIDMFFVK